MDSTELVFPASPVLVGVLVFLSVVVAGAWGIGIAWVLRGRRHGEAKRSLDSCATKGDLADLDLRVSEAAVERDDRIAALEPEREPPIELHVRAILAKFRAYMDDSRGFGPGPNCVAVGKAFMATLRGELAKAWESGARAATTEPAGPPLKRIEAGYDFDGAVVGALGWTDSGASKRVNALVAGKLYERLEALLTREKTCLGDLEVLAIALHRYVDPKRTGEQGPLSCAAAFLVEDRERLVALTDRLQKELAELEPERCLRDRLKTARGIIADLFDGMDHTTDCQADGDDFGCSCGLNAAEDFIREKGDG